MIVYRAEKRTFLHDSDHRSIEDLILAEFQSKTGRTVARNEVVSWRESLRAVAMVLRDDEISDDLGVAVEFVLPQSTKRIDVTLSGLGNDYSKHVVILELKQWEAAKASSQDGIVMTRLGGAERAVVHPSYQAWSYAAFLEGFNTAVYAGGVKVHACAYLHNYVSDGMLDGPNYDTYIERAPLFLKGDGERDRLRQYVKGHISHGDGGAVLQELDEAPIRPSKALADYFGRLLAGQPEFILLDEQKQVYEAAIAAASAASSEHPRVLIVQGGPGTGKSVVAVNLLGTLLKRGLNPKYVSRNAAPRAVYKAKLIGGDRVASIDSLFAGAGSFIRTPRDAFNVLIVDEAHRLTELSGFYGNEGEHQVKELVNAAKCAIFFIDEDQRVTLKDIGTKDIIRRYATERGCEIEEYELQSQFRCGGSDGYLAWLDDVLDIRATANMSLRGVDYDFRVFDDPESMHAAIRERNVNNKARVVAGYCWRWKSRKDPDAFDIQLDGYARRWNLEKYGSLWIMDSDSIEEVGCIHTCQGLEVEYIGVIVGPDLVFQAGKVVTVPEARDGYDRTMRGYGRMLAENQELARKSADRIVRNTYRALMTRGMKGCYVYATDPELRAYIRKRI